MLGNLTTALMMMSTRMDNFSQGKASPVDITSAQPTAAVLSAQPRTKAGGNSTVATSQMAFVPAQLGIRAGGIATASASADSDMEESLRNMVEY